MHLEIFNVYFTCQKNKTFINNLIKTYMQNREEKF